MFRNSYALTFAVVFLCAHATLAPAQPTPGTISKSFDFRNGALAWQGGFADYPPLSDKDSFYELRSEIRSLPPELNVNGTGFFIQGNNHSDDLFMFLKRRLDAADGIVAGQTYQITYTIVFASNASAQCIGPGSPGGSVYMGAGGSPAEPLALFTPAPSDPRVFAFARMNIDKSELNPGGIAISVIGNIDNGLPCNPGQASPYVSLQRTHQHTSLVNANARGELWLIVGTDSGYEGTTALYYQRIEVTLTPMAQQPPVLLTYRDRMFIRTDRAAALESTNMLLDPLPVISERNLLSLDRHTRINLFGYNLELKSGEDKTAITVEAEDAQHRVYQLPVEAVNEVPNFNWISQITARLTDEVQGLGELSLRVRLRGVPSNQLPITIQ